MIKPFAVVVFLLILMIFAVGFHYTLFPYKETARSIQNITVLTQMTPLSLSVSYDELIYTTTYPDMQGLGRMDFVYEQ